MSDPDHICHYCKQEMLLDQQRWSGREPAQNWHYDCATAAGLTAESARAIVRHDRESAAKADARR